MVEIMAIWPGLLALAAESRRNARLVRLGAEYPSPKKVQPFNYGRVI